MEAVEFRQGWSVAARRGREKKRKTKEGGLLPEEGDVKEEEDQGFSGLVLAFAAGL